MRLRRVSSPDDRMKQGIQTMETHSACHGMTARRSPTAQQASMAIASEPRTTNPRCPERGARLRWLTLLLLTACATNRTVSVTESVDLPAAPSRTWDMVKDFMHWQLWHPAFVSTDLVRGDGRSEGTVRLLTTKEGGKFTEELVSYNDASRTYRYRIIDSAAPVTGYVSTLMVKESKIGSSVVWSSTFKVKPGTSDEDARKLISGVYRAGLDNLASLVQ
jgi:Polyketide cyclase / dehydrase and lipid transport